MPPATLDQTRTLAERSRDALLESFSASDLLMLVGDRLRINLDEVVNRNQEHNAVVFDLVRWALRKGRLCELLSAAADRVPGKPILAALCSECVSGSSGTPQSAAERARLRDAVVRFAERFRQRQRSVRLLEAYKSLHDILHELEGFQDTINRAVAAARGGPAGPDAESVVDQLRDWAAAAAEWAKQTRAPQIHRKWTRSFDEHVEVIAKALTGSGPLPADFNSATTGSRSDVNRAVECLANLPAERQSGLNDLLIETLADFQSNDLQQPLAEVLDAVWATSGGAAFEDRLTAFNAAVQAVADRSRDHDFCQKVSDILIQACQLTVVTADKVTAWADVCNWLNQLAGYRPTDQRVKRTAESAKRFDEATTPAEATVAFRRLEERFADLFYVTDKSLLADTQRLVSTADALSAHLDGMLK
jgi:hypothetical protein